MSYIETWKAMEKLVDEGLAKSIGLSNFNSQQINEVLAIAKIKPVTNQVGTYFLWYFEYLISLQL